jgi:hypothetical protein
MKLYWIACFTFSERAWLPQINSGKGGKRPLFDQKRRKNFCSHEACGAETSTAQIIKVFLLLFVHKKKPSPSLT